MSLAYKSILVLAALLLVLTGQHPYATDKKALDFSLENFDGQTVTMQNLKGKRVVLTFSFAFCSVRCPVISGRLSALDAQMDANRDVVYLHVSVDPEMDTPENRRNYFKLYGIDAVRDKRWLFVSGFRDELSKLWKFYGIDIRKVLSKDIPEAYYMEYTPKVVIIDKNGLVAYETDFYFSADRLLNLMRELN